MHTGYLFWFLQRMLLSPFGRMWYDQGKNIERERNMDKYVIFDIDGTLNQTALYAVEAYQTALAKRGREVSAQEVISCIGSSPEVIIQKFFGTLGEEEREAWSREIKELEFGLMEQNARPFEGIPEALAKLKSEGYKLAICSNNFLEHIDHVLNAIHVREYFDVIASLELGKDKAEVLGNLLKKIGSASACLAGDRIFDLRAARENKIPLIGCAYGYAPEEIQQADVVVTSPKGLPDAVKQLTI